MSGPFVGARLTDDLQNLKLEINRDRAILSLPAPSGLYVVSQPGAIELHWNELPESYRRSIDGARIWRARSSVDDRKDFHANQDKQIIVPMIRSTVYTDPVGNTSEQFIYWVQWVNLDGNPSEATGGVTGVALFDSGAPGPLENLSVTGGDGRFQGSWSDPLTNILTLDNFAQQYSSTSGYTTAGGNICVTWLLGKIYSHGSSAPGEVLWFRYAAHNQSGDTTTNNDPRLTALLPDGWGPWTEPAEGNPVSSGWDTGPDTGPPDTITVDASANGLTILFGAQAMNNQFTVEEGEIRIKAASNAAQMTANLTTPDYTYPGNPATQYGSRLTWPAPRAGRYFYSWRLRNSAFGWSAWTGDPTLNAVPHYIDTNDKTDIGPPEDWTIQIVPGPDANSVHVKTTRPKINGANLLWVSYQIRDTSGGQPWRAVDEGVGASEVYYDGSAINHKITDGGNRIYRESGTGFGSAGPGHLILLDVRGGVFHRNHCQWGQVTDIKPDYIEIEGGFRPQVMSGLRLKIVKYPHTWNTEGYLGDLYNHGQDWDKLTNTRDAEFTSKAIPIDGNFNEIDARAWFENHYCRSDATGASGPPTVTNSKLKVVKQRDDVIPGAVIGLSVTGADGKFTAKWSDPTTGYATIDDTAIQYTTDAGFTINGPGSITRNLGHTNLETGLDPAKVYYFRVAVHNQSDKDSDPSTGTAGPGFLGAKGWGPWTVFGSPTSVYSGFVPGSGGATDSVIPSQLQNLQVQGQAGEFVADWRMPAFGYNTIDDIAEQWATDPAFTSIAGFAKGWGPVMHLQSTAPNKTYYFRFAAHNQSGQPSDSSTWAATDTPTTCGPTGWGPWTPYMLAGSPSAVSSGNLPIPTQPLDGTQIPASLVPNGGFELDVDVDGKPDGWILGEEGIAGGSWFVATFIKTEGKNCLYMQGSPGGASWGLMSDSFPVRTGEKMVFSLWTTSNNGAQAGCYHRLLFHENNPDFNRAQAGTNYIDCMAQGVVPGGWTFYEYEFTVPPNMGFCRVGLYNWTYGAPNYDLAFDDVRVYPQLAGNVDIEDNSIGPGILTGAARTDFVETFDRPLDPTVWTFSTHDGVVTYPYNGIDGGKTMRVVGSKEIYGAAPGGSPVTLAIPFDPRKLYRMSVRIYCGGITQPANSLICLGVMTFNANGVRINNQYVAANMFQWYGVYGIGWQTFTGYFKGHGAPLTPAPDAANPAGLDPGTSYMTPVVVLNYPYTTGLTGNIWEIDDIKIESFDEQVYSPSGAPRPSAAPNGTLTKQPLWILAPMNPGTQDTKTATVYLQFTYLQGSIKAHQIALSITDNQIGAWVARYALPPGDAVAGYHIAVYGLDMSRTVYLKVCAEALAYGGQVAGPVGDFGAITPSANVGSNLLYQNIGELDWRGGAVWFDSIQYRNNLPPSNGMTTATINFPLSGSGTNHCKITGMAYPVNGPNIATHIAILLRADTNLIVLGRDMVVAYLPANALPTEYEIPIELASNGAYRVAVVAVAMTRNGPQAHGTFVQTPAKNPEGITLQTFQAPRSIFLGSPETSDAGTIIDVWKDMRMQDALLKLYHGGADCGHLRGFNGNILWSNNGGKVFFITPGGSGGSAGGSWGFGVGPNAQANGVVYIGNMQMGASAYPTNGGGLYSEGGTLKWITQGGNIREIAYAGPHCAKCGYDYWLIGVVTPKWESGLYVCGVCGTRYFKGPKSVLHLLDEQAKSEIITKKNFYAEQTKTLDEGLKNVATRTSRASRLRRRGTGQRRKPGQNKLRRARSR